MKDRTAQEDVFTAMARNTGVFREEELEVLEELVWETTVSGKTNYRMMREEAEGKIIGFIIFGRTPLTTFSWDIYWLVVDRAHHGFGTGKKLLRMAGEEMLSASSRAVIRVETSSRKEYLPARNFYANQGFSAIGSISDFYGKEDDLVIYSKEIASTGAISGGSQ